MNDSFEEGKSLSIGVDFRKEDVEDINKYFEFKLATVFRDEEENFIPKKVHLIRSNRIYLEKYQIILMRILL